MLFMEYSLGQYFGIGSLSIFKKVCPLVQGELIMYSDCYSSDEQNKARKVAIFLI